MWRTDKKFRWSETVPFTDGVRGGGTLQETVIMGVLDEEEKMSCSKGEENGKLRVAVEKRKMDYSQGEKVTLIVEEKMDEI